MLCHYSFISLYLSCEAEGMATVITETALIIKQSKTGEVSTREQNLNNIPIPSQVATKFLSILFFFIYLFISFIYLFIYLFICLFICIVFWRVTS